MHLECSIEVILELKLLGYHLFRGGKRMGSLVEPITCLLHFCEVDY